MSGKFFLEAFFGSGGCCAIVLRTLFNTAFDNYIIRYIGDTKKKQTNK